MAIQWTTILLQKEPPKQTKQKNRDTQSHIMYWCCLDKVSARGKFRERKISDSTQGWEDRENHDVTRIYFLLKQSECLNIKDWQDGEMAQHMKLLAGKAPNPSLIVRIHVKERINSTALSSKLLMHNMVSACYIHHTLKII